MEERIVINVVIVEDESSAMEVLQTFLDRYTKEKQTEFNVVWFDNPVNFLANYKPNFDLILLDIELPEFNGMETARKIRDIDSSVALIFVTNMAQYAVSGYEVDADDFIVKPVSYHDFVLKLERVLKKINNKDDAKIAVAGDGEIRYLVLRDIRYVEVIKHKLIYHTIEKDFEVRGSLNKIESLCAENDFLQCNKYCIVNPRFVAGVHGHTLTMTYGRNFPGKYDELQISHPRRKDFVKSLNDYLRKNV